MLWYQPLQSIDVLRFTQSVLGALNSISPFGVESWAAASRIMILRPLNLNRPKSRSEHR